MLKQNLTKSKISTNKQISNSQKDNQLLITPKNKQRRLEQTDDNYAVEMINIRKSFLNGKVVANDNITLRVKKNEIHAIIGENGAGKSTLMSVLFGIYSPDSGTIKINGKNVYFSSAKDAADAGLGMVHQHFKLVPTYSVFENIILGSEDVTKLGFLKNNKNKKIIENLIKQYHFNLNVNAKISSLTVGQEQKTEILKLLYRNSDILIFDEPTAVLSPDEIEQFLEMVLQFKREGKTVIIITHKFTEIKSVADHATVIRLGKYVADFRVKDKSVQEMANLMVGKEVSLIKNNINNPFGKCILNVKNLKILHSMLPNSFIFNVRNPEVKKLRSLVLKDVELMHKLKHKIDYDISEQEHNQINQKMEQLKTSFRNRQNVIIDKYKTKLKNGRFSLFESEQKIRFKIDKYKGLIDYFNKEFSSQFKNKIIDFKIHEGEIFAIAGVEGNGQSELALIIAGMVKNKSAVIKLCDEDISKFPINKRYEIGLSHVPEDRHKHGLILDEQVYMNLCLNRISSYPYSSFGFLREKYIKENARELIKKYDVRGTTRGSVPARLLSGGNQQKLIIAREITNEHKLIIMVQPTRGLDLGAIEYIHNKIIEEKTKGNAVLLISYELDEILALADTIAVINNGVFVGVGNKREMTRERIGQLMAGNE